MQSEMSPSRRAILEALMAADAPQSLDDLFTADVAGLSRTGIYRQLQGMVEEGLVQRTGARQDARYAPQERTGFSWSLRLGSEWRLLEWVAEPPVDIRYPLASRLPDAAGRQALIRFLSEIQAQNLDQPWRMLDEAFEQGALDEEVAGLSEDGKREFRRWIRNPSSHGTITVVAFGSCARGDARSDSDLDLLVITPHGFGSGHHRRRIERKEMTLPGLYFERMFKDLAYELEVGLPRPLDLKVVGEDDVVDLPPGLLKAIRRDGMTVHATRPSSYWVEAWSNDMEPEVDAWR